MLTAKQIEKIKIKMVLNNLNQSKLARRLHCSNGAITRVFNQDKNCSKLEQKMLDWLNDTSRGETKNGK